MSSQNSAQKNVLLVADCIFNSDSETGIGPKEAQKLQAAIKNVFEATKKKGVCELTLIYAEAKYAKNKKEEEACSSDFDLQSQLSVLSKKLGCLFNPLYNMKTFEAVLITAKYLIDELKCSDVNIIVPQIETSYFKRAAQLIYNEQAYSLTFTPVDIPASVDEHESKSDDEIKSTIADILSKLPSSDKLPVETLHSPIIPEELFYHGYTTRAGGVSTWPTMRSLNLCFSPRKKDTWAYVEENRRRLAVAAGFEYKDLKMPRCVHGIDVWVIGDEAVPETFDAMVTDKPGITLGAPGADCQTMLFCDPVKKVVAAAHSGWKGTIDRIQQNVVRVMRQRFHCDPNDILVSIGPSIGQCCYEFGKDVAQKFIDSVSPATVLVKENGKSYLDLWHASIILLQEVGIPRQNIDDGKRFAETELNGRDKVTQCTYCNPDKFFSYRRDGALFGNQIGFIGIKRASQGKTE
eukprot:gene4860-5498_t